MSAFLKFIKKDNFYKYIDSNSKELALLGRFLRSDVGFLNINFFRNWALDENQYATGGNLSALEKENGFVLIGEETSKWEEDDPYIKISIDNFIKILDQWEQFCKTKPKEILITRENGEIKMEGEE